MNRVNFNAERYLELLYTSGSLVLVVIDFVESLTKDLLKKSTLEYSSATNTPS